MEYLKTLEQRMAEILPELDAIEKGEIVSNEKFTDGIIADLIEGQTSGEAEFKVSFVNHDGENATVLLRDTGNRRGSGENMSAAFVALENGSSDGRNYVGVAKMKQSDIGKFKIESFVIYEN